MANRHHSAASPGVLARPLPRNVRGGPLRLLAAIADEVSGSVDAAADELESARQLLHRRAGGRALELPVAAGRAAVRLEELLAQGPTAIDPGGVQAAHASTAATKVLAAAEALIVAVDEESAVLSEVLFEDLAGLTIDELEEVATAILGLGTGVRPVAGWGTSAGADAATRVLRLAAPDMRAAASSHTLLYELFTDGVWQVPDALLDAGRDRRRVWSRARLRRRLCASSRTGRLPGGLTAVAQQVVDVRVDRDRVAAQSGLRTEYLDHLDRGPLTDVDAALAALGALRRLQTALGSALDEERLGRLLLADAFRSPEVQNPAANVRLAIEV